MTSSKTVGDFAVEGKILLITGGGSCIGLAFTKHFVAKGGRVLIGDLKLTGEGEAFLHETEVDKPGTVVFRTCDVTDWNSLRDLISASVQEFGEVPDVYCPCAGVFEPPSGSFWDDKEDSGYATIRINVEHPIKLTRLAFRALVGADKKGVVLLVSSVAGLIGVYGTPLYAASKHAVVGLCKSLEQADCDEGVKVVCICPGMVATPLWEGRSGDRAAEFSHYEESGRNSTPDEIAEAMIKLVEDGQYGGGTLYVKTHAAGGVVDQTLPNMLHAAYPQSVLGGERGIQWNA